MQEVIPVVLDYGFTNLKLETIEGEVAPGNVKSIRLLQKFGFRFKNTFIKTDIYILNSINDGS